MKRTKRILLVAFIVLATVLSGCSREPASLCEVRMAPPGAQLTTVNVGSMYIPEAATLQVAASKGGYLERQGLRANTTFVQGGGAALPLLQTGKLDVAIMNYVTALQHEAARPDELKFLADAYQAGKNTFKLMVRKDSPLRTPADLRGKTVAVVTLESIGTLSTEYVLAEYGLTKNDVTMTAVPLQKMTERLERSRTAPDAEPIDAAWMTEPFITSYASQFGGRTLVDVMDSALDSFPIAGWATTKTWASKHTDLLTRFQIAMSCAQSAVDGNRALVTKALLGYIPKLDAKTAESITLGTFPLSLSRNRLQRVADQMQERNYLRRSLDVCSMLLPMPALTPTPEASPSPSTTNSHQECAP
ncbi:ABC transporter substrate-binding protein [Nonomuraea sp. NPDC049400]|uniref:ABC transporter substrate-binding protein n=1 Tax=Nonomuraea sp. NPDC049400 TaxID=3364352 RepID=UPI00379680FB